MKVKRDFDREVDKKKVDKLSILFSETISEIYMKNADDAVGYIKIVNNEKPLELVEHTDATR